jgi:dihydroorotase
MKVYPQNTILIKGGHVFDPQQKLDAVMDIFIENDRIVSLGTPPQGFTANATINAEGKMVFPGFIDLHAFLGESGFSQKGSISRETQAAARSGITSLCSTPNTKPVVDSATLAALIQDKAKQAGFCRVLPIGALTAGLQGEQLSNMYGLKDAGCVALSNNNAPFKDSRVIQQCFHYAAGFDIQIFSTPLDTALAHEGCMHEGPTSTQLGLAGNPECAETSSVAQQIIVCEETGIRLHFSRITSKRALDMIIEAQQKGLPVSADVALGNLYFTDEDCAAYDSLMHVTPVYRSSTDKQALLDAVNDGHISICSNHCPHELASKMAPFAASAAGISVLDSFASALFNLVHDDKLTLSSAISAVSSLPAKVLRQPLGQLTSEGRADLCIVDMSRSACLNTQDLASKGHNNPWIETPLMGQVICTINDGHIVYQA